MGKERPEIDKNKVAKALRKLGFTVPRRGRRNGGHNIWMNEAGVSVQFVDRHRNVPYPFIQAMGWELEKKGVLASHREFLQLVKDAC